MNTRQSHIERKTNETNIFLTLDLNGTSQSCLETGIPFFNHMLEQWVRHSGFDLELKVIGDLAVDAHHTIEDCGIVLGMAFSECLQDRANVARFGYAYAPLDESLSRVVIDLSGRPSLHYCAQFSRLEVGGIDVDLFREFLQAFVNHAQVTLHVDLLRGVNCHHQIESLFKALALSTSMAVSQQAERGIPSTKGVL